MSEAHTALAHQFDDAEQQYESSQLGMWLFLVTEIMFFGGLFAAYTIYRHLSLPGFEAGSRILDIRLGATNTGVLIASSFTMALAVRAAQTGSRKGQMAYLALTMLLGLVFLGVKVVEYRQKYVEHLIPCQGAGCSGLGLSFAPQGEVLAGILHHGALPSQVELFFCFYFFMTGMHALHMVIGVAILSVLVWMTLRGRFSPDYYAPVEMTGLYWHFVDIVWIFLFPLLYLIGRHFR